MNGEVSIAVGISGFDDVRAYSDTKRRGGSATVSSRDADGARVPFVQTPSLASLD